MKRASAASAASRGAGEGARCDANDRRFDVEVLVPKAFASALALPGATEELFAAAEAEERALLLAAPALGARGSGSGEVSGEAEWSASVATTLPPGATHHVEAIPNDALAAAELDAAGATERRAVAVSPLGARESSSRASASPASSSVRTSVQSPAKSPTQSPAQSPTTSSNDVDGRLTDVSARMGILAVHFGSGAMLPPPPPGAARSERATAPPSVPPSTTERLRASCLDHFGVAMLAKVYAYVREIGVAAYDTDPAARGALEDIIGSKAIRQVDLVSMLIAAEDVEDAIVLKVGGAADAPPAAAAAGGGLLVIG